MRLKQIKNFKLKIIDYFYIHTKKANEIFY